MSFNILSRLRSLILLVWFACVLPGSVLAGGAPDTAPPGKYALVIGNGNYTSGKHVLKNPANDAKLLGQSLSKLGFEVQELFDLNKSQLISAVSAFSDRLPPGATSMVFFAGHGMQLGGASYLLPVDMAVTSEQSVALRAYPIKSLLEKVSSSKAAVNIVVIDACRDNPFQPTSGTKYRNFSNLGLGQVLAPRGTLVAYSTSPGQLAADGNEANSVYTSSLARAILEPRTSLVSIFSRVGDQVRKKTLDDQIPWFETSLNEDYYFFPPEGMRMAAGRTLQGAGKTQIAKSEGRGMGTTNNRAVEPPWYRSMSDYEWSKLDFDIQQRVKYMTLDETPMMEHRAKGGSVVAQMTLGAFWLEGASRVKESGSGKVARYGASNTKSVVWLRMAAKAGFPIAQAQLGEMLFRGHGVDRDPLEARRLFTSASQANYPRAKLDLFQIDLEEGKSDGGSIGSVIESMVRGATPPSKQQP